MRELERDQDKENTTLAQLPTSASNSSLSHSASDTSLNSATTLAGHMSSSRGTTPSPASSRFSMYSPFKVQETNSNTHSHSEDTQHQPYTYSPSEWTSNGMDELSPKSSMPHQWQSLVPEDLQTPADEKDDVFLPLSPNSSTPYQVNFGYQSRPANSWTPTAQEPITPSRSNSISSGNMTAAERREHSRRHSRIHSRNLSVFFPRPEVGQPSPLIIPEDSVIPESSVNIPTASIRAWTGQSATGSQISRSRIVGNQSVTHANAAATSPIEENGKPSSRRGHHHRHSLSHKLVFAYNP